MTTPITQAADRQVVTYTGVTVNGVQQEAEVLMARHSPKDWPSVKDGLDQWERQTKALEAIDFPIPLHAIRMNPDTGGLYNVIKNPKGNAGIIPTHTALAHLTSFVESAPAQVVANLEFYPPQVRAAMVFDLLNRVPTRDVTLRTALLSKGQGAMPDSRVIRAVVSDKHSREHGDDLAVIAELRKVESIANSKIRVVKRWDSTHVEVYLPHKVLEVKPGRPIYGKLNFSNSETKGGSYEASVATFDLWCKNGAVAQSKGTTISIKHMGDIRYKMAASTKTIVELVDDVMRTQKEAYHTALPCTRAEAIERLVKRHKLPEATGSALAALWDVDGADMTAGDTVAGAVNALTRHAQSLDISKALTVEEVAGKVLAAGLGAFL